jgi:hypothetical protein
VFIYPSHSYTTEKHTPPILPDSSIQDAKQRRQYRDPRYIKHEQQKEINTVLQTYVDPIKENNMKQKEIKEKEKQREQAVVSRRWDEISIVGHGMEFN